MRSRSFSIIALAAAIFCAVSLFAQSEPTTTWPYIYQDFTEAEIYTAGKQKVVQKVNVHLAHSRIHYLDRGVIMELNPADVVAVIVGNDKFVPVDGAMYKVVASSSNGLVLELSLGDFAALEESGGAYGTSSASSSTMKLSSVDASSVLGRSHMLILQSKHEGKILPLKTQYYVKTPEFFCRATKNELDRQFSGDAQGWKEWLKAHKIRWNNPSSLAQLTDYLDKK